MDIKEIAKELGKRGGLKTSQKYGPDYYRELQRKSVESKKNKKIWGYFGTWQAVVDLIP